MADFLKSIFAIPSDDCSSSGGSLVRKKGHNRTLTPLSLTDGSGNGTTTSREGTLSYGNYSLGDDNRSEQPSSTSTNSETIEDRFHRRGGEARRSRKGRQRRNDTSAHRSASEQPRRSSSMIAPGQRRNNSLQLQLNSPKNQGRRRRSLSKTDRGSKQKMDYNSLSSSNRTRSDHTMEEVKKKEKKDWRFKLSTGGMKKHPSHTQQQSKNNGKMKNQQYHSNKNNHQRISSRENRGSSLLLPSAPINVGDSIVISQQFLEENAEMSVLTLPHELASISMNEEVEDVDFDDRTIQGVRERRVTGNGHIRASPLLERQQQNTSRKEKIGAYASRCSYRSYTHDQPIGHDNGDDTVQGKLSPPPPRQGKSLTHFEEIQPSDPPGDPYQPFDESPVMQHGPSSKAAPQNSSSPEADQRNIRSNKAVSFALPPPSSATAHPPAPPFMGPPLYYYSMEHDPNRNDPPLWSNSPLLPPIIELWSSVETADVAVSGMWDATRERMDCWEKIYHCTFQKGGLMSIRRNMTLLSRRKPIMLTLRKRE